MDVILAFVGGDGNIYLDKGLGLSVVLGEPQHGQILDFFFLR